ncbi:MAG: TRAFs-binding domain-containing protein [Candidatus Omnitrophota bacterium]
MNPEQKPEDDLLTNQFCLVLIPFGEKLDAGGRRINYDSIYNEIISPAIEQAGLTPIRADEEKTNGFIQKRTYERLLLCDYAIVDLTVCEPMLMYQLGVRDAAIPARTILVFDERVQLPFGFFNLRTVSYRLDDRGKIMSVTKDRLKLSMKIKTVMEEPHAGSPVSRLIGKLKDRHLDPSIYNDFFNQMLIMQSAKLELKTIKGSDKSNDKKLESYKELEKDLGNIDEVESGFLIDLLLAYRSVEGWTEMLELVEKMPTSLGSRINIQEQYAFALNRAGMGLRAEEVLKGLINSSPRSETYGLLGRIYKDRWQEAIQLGDENPGEDLKKAFDNYLKGFRINPRDFYPGVNALSLLDVNEAMFPRKKELHEVVKSSVKQKLFIGIPDYWGYATLLELAVLENNQEEALQYLNNVLKEKAEPWQLETTARNLHFIRENREKRGISDRWIADIEVSLLSKS